MKVKMVTKRHLPSRSVSECPASTTSSTKTNNHTQFMD